ncbi:MAG: guanylate kinase [Candidatus Omnitrophica bacterium]|nr:guanylate kinase [Candidatus Omnitrophota bacterium]
MRKGEKGKIFVISAPSGSGKTTICKEALKRVKNLVPSISLTTRNPRRGEKDKKDYCYTTVEVFKKKINNNEFLEWEENFGNFYGTPRRFVSDKIKDGKDVLLSIDVKGAANIKKRFPESVLIFIKPPSIKELLRRLKARNTDCDEEIARRINIAKKELKRMSMYDYVVVNKKLNDAIKEIIGIITKEREVRGGVYSRGKFTKKRK